MRNCIIVAVLFLAIGIGGDQLWQWKCNSTPSKPDIGKPGKPQHGTFETVVSPSKVVMPYGGVIVITPTLNKEGNTLHLRAEDKLKWTEQDWPIKCAPVAIPWRKHIIGLEAMGLVGYNHAIQSIDVLYGGGLNYTRIFGGTFGLGGGLMVLHGMMSKDTYYGAKIILLVQFGK